MNSLSRDAESQLMADFKHSGSLGICELSVLYRISFGPPNVHACQSFHLHYSCWLKCNSVNTGPVVLENHYPGTPQWDNRKRASALEWCPVGQKARSYRYPTRRIAHLCTLAAAKAGCPLFSPIIAINGLWSVTNVKCWPYTNLWNFFMPKIDAKTPFSICA